MPTPTNSALFVLADAIAELQNYRLPMMAANFPLPVIPDAATLTKKILAAESELARKLGIYLQPTTIFGGADPSADAIAALNGAPYAVESGYDMTPDFFSTWQWGTFLLRSRPVQSVASIKFIYPSLNAQVVDIPTTWMQVDKRIGLVNLVPGPGGLNIPLNIFSMQAMNSGSTVPNMIRVVYVAGLDPSNPFYADVQDMAMKLVALRILKDTFQPQSGSISADGLSQSVSTDVTKFGAAIDSEIADLRERLVGPILGTF
ncbi:hypothetical protein [Burkholderia sp. Ac-20349]|uniref:hypothetical protein n=1 Tax=Burkholderia sp. Ac-20349 TaxID=2703893 RepID=UPI00197B3806|nr:hypothetical protein [Burkholderia sp. Ac-20349]MBN3839287.1 hypothetical protein [Burkholderia sp. Ac-20349]